MFYELQEVVERLKREVRPVRQQTPSPSDAIKIQEQIWRSYIMRLAFIDKLEENWRFVRLGYLQEVGNKRFKHPPNHRMHNHGIINNFVIILVKWLTHSFFKKSLEYLFHYSIYLFI